MGLFSRNKSSEVLNLDWSPLDAPENAEELKKRVTLESSMLEREPSRRNDYIDFTYLDALPETKGIAEEILIACGHAHLVFTNKSEDATAYLTDKRLVLLGKYKGLNVALGSFHNLLLGVRPESKWELTVNWRDPKCPVLGFGPRFGKDGKANRYAMEWWYSFAQIARNVLE